ncbi:MAG: S8 family serine peptidase, partial [Bdellovibrionota bacterium]
MNRFLLAAITVALATTAQAGEVLRLKAGTMKPAELERNWDVSLHPEAQRTFVVQFKDHVTLADRQNLTSLGAKILRYLPDDALVVSANPRIARTIAQSSPAVSSVITFEPSWKVAPEIAPASVFSAETTAVLHLRLFPGLTAKGERLIREQIGALAGVEVLESQERSMVVRAKHSSLQLLARIEMVEWIQLQPTFETLAFNDDEIQANAETEAAGDYSDLDGYESGTRVMKFDHAWKRGLTGHGQIVGVADTGLDSGDVAAVHPDFSGRITKGLIFGLFSKTWADPMGHGTHVAGSVLGSGSKSNGALKGGAYEANVVAESMWSPMLGGLSVPSKMGDLFGQAYDQGARIHTNSWGSPASVGAYDSFAQQTDEFTTSRPDMLILFAAGNSGVDMDKDGRIDPNSIGSPGTAKNVLTIGASKNLVSKGGIQKMMKELRNGADNWGVEPIASSRLSDNIQGIAGFSSRGPTADGRT